MTCGTTSPTEQERQGGHWKKWRTTLGLLPGNELFRLFGESFRNSFEIHVERRGSRDESYAVHGHGYRESAAGPAVSDAREEPPDQRHNVSTVRPQAIIARQG